MLALNKNRCLIIAEAGVNHNGSVHLAKKLIDAAKEAGADIVKFQTWITDLIVTEESSSAAYQEENTGTESQYELLKSLELAHDDFVELKKYAEAEGIAFLSTPDEEVSARFLIDNGMEMIKVGSGELTNLPFLDFLAKERLPMIISTGMSDMKEVSRAVATIRATGLEDLSILHCVSNYPADPAECNLQAMLTMQREFQCPVGYSDHTMGNEICFAAVAMGARVIEKHLTLDRSMDGPDHMCSADPDEFKELVIGIRKIESSLGDGVKRPAPSEMATRNVVRKEIVAAKDINIGQTVTMSDLALKRGNGDGIGADQIDTIVGKVARSRIVANAVVRQVDLERSC